MRFGLVSTLDVQAPTLGVNAGWVGFPLHSAGRRAILKVGMIATRIVESANSKGAEMGEDGHLSPSAGCTPVSSLSSYTA
jgi:hypothetical protein